MKWAEEANDAANRGFVFSVANTKLPLEGGTMQGGTGMAGNRILHLGEPLLDKDAICLNSGNEYYLRRDGSNWMRNDLSLGGFRAREMRTQNSNKTV